VEKGLVDLDQGIALLLIAHRAATAAVGRRYGKMSAALNVSWQNVARRRLLQGAGEARPAARSRSHRDRAAHRDCTRKAARYAL
jgi:hypothetical protein